MDRIETISYDLKEEVFVVYLERNGTYGPPRTIRIKPSQLENAFDEAFQRAVASPGKSEILQTGGVQQDHG